MEKKLAIELTLRPVGADCTDDTAGHGVIIEDRQLPRQAFLLTPIVILTDYPVRPPVVKAGDVSGFMMRSKHLDEHPEGDAGSKPASDWGPLAFGTFIMNCFVTFGEGVANAKP